MSTAAASVSLRNDAEVIGLVGLAHGTSHFYHLMLPPLFPWLMREFALSFTEAGLLMTVFFTVSGVGQALAGFVVDRVGARPVLFFGIAAWRPESCSEHRTVAALPTAADRWTRHSIFHPADFTPEPSVTTPRLGHAFSVHGCPAISAGPWRRSSWQV
jgi:hypothetical protein